MLRTKTNSGFTIPELIITITVGAIIMGLIFGPLNDLYDSNTQGVRSIVQASDARSALRQIEREINLSASFLDKNNVNDYPSTAWQWRGVGSTNNPDARVLITQNFATAVIGSNDRIVVTGSDCKTIQSVNYIYFVKNNALYRRTLKNASYPATCEGVTMSQKRTCANLSDDTAKCEALDAKIVSGVKTFTVDYYEKPQSTTPLDNLAGHTRYSSATSTVPATAKTIVITLTLSTGSISSPVLMTTNLRITKMNKAT